METKRDKNRRKKGGILQIAEIGILFDVGYRRIRETHGSTDGTFGIHGQKNQADAWQVLPNPRTWNGERLLLVFANTR